MTRIFLLALLACCFVGAQAQTYQVLKIIGSVTVDDKVLQVKDKVKITKDSKIKFQPPTAKAAIYSNSEGIGALFIPAEKQTTAASFIEGKLVDYFQLSKKPMATRKVFTSKVNLEKEFQSDPYYIFGDEIQHTIEIPELPQNDDQFYYITYELEGDDEPINKILNHATKRMIINKDDLFKVDGKPIDPSRVSNMQMAHYNSQTETTSLIGKVNIIFVDSDVLRETTDLIVEALRDNGLADKEIQDQLIAYLNKNYISVSHYGNSTFEFFNRENAERWSNKIYDLPFSEKWPE